MRRLKSTILLAGALLLTPALAQANNYVVTIEQIGSNVVATGSGEINLTGLSLSFSGSGASPEMVSESEFLIFTGAGGAGSADQYDASFSGPMDFGTGGFFAASTGSGNTVGAFFASGDLYIDTPHSYVSGTALSSSAAWDNKTFTSLGLTPGVYTWTWGGGSCSTDQCFTLDVGVPGPIAGAGLPGLVFAGIGFLAWWRRKRTPSENLAAA